jgi:hypothetical protein
MFQASYNGLMANKQKPVIVGKKVKKVTRDERLLDDKVFVEV